MVKALRILFMLLLATSFLMEAGEAEAARRKKKNNSPRTRMTSMTCSNPKDAKSCMACNCFNEAGNQSYEGQVAVGKVVMTRVGLKAYPNSVCGVIKQRYQFSWFNKASTRRPVPRGHSCLKAADESLKFRGYFADHYHATWMKRKPRWAKRMQTVGLVGQHRFYSSYSRRGIDPGDQSQATQGYASLLLSLPALQGLIEIRDTI